MFGENKKFHLNKMWIAICVLAILLIAVVAINIFGASQPFSKDTTAIAKAEESVVKIYCYDENNNEVATGSGFIIFENNICVTNYHVLTDAYTYKISTSEDITLSAEGIIHCSEEKDIAIIKLQEDLNLTPLDIEDSNKIKKGETVTAIGSPLGIKNTISQGILSGRIMMDDMDVLQITAPISGGSSGGALFDDNGKVIGVTFASYEEGQNLNLAIPINEVKELYEKTKNRRLKESNYIFLESNPGYKTFNEYINKYKDAEPVSINTLKSKPNSYDGTLIKFTATVSSVDTEGSVSFVSSESHISGNENSDWFAYANKDFEQYHVIKIQSAYQQNLNISVGDTVVVIGFFDYIKKGEKTLEFSDEPFVGKPAKHNYGKIYKGLIYEVL